MAIWRFFTPETNDVSSPESSDEAEESIEVTRLKVPGAPVFSLAKIPDVRPDGTVQRRKPTGRPSGIYIGTAAKEVTTWMLGSADVTDKVILRDHTGWVRSLAVTGKWLFSCGCNVLRAWDTTYRTPKEAQSVRLFTGDILAITATRGRVFTAGADGSLRSWAIGGCEGGSGGRLEEGPAVERAHEGRVAGCTAHDDCVYTVSYDGDVKAWSATTLELVAEVRRAHGGEKVHCVAVGANGVIFTGGDDKLIRAWDPCLRPLGPPLEGHAASVRVLAAGRRGLLVSGDADGDVCMWETHDVPSALLAPPAAAAAAANGYSNGRGNVAAPAGSLHVGLSTAARLELEDLYAPSRPAGDAVAAAAAATSEATAQPSEAAAAAEAELAAAAAAAAAELECSIMVARGAEAAVAQQPEAAPPLQVGAVAAQPEAAQFDEQHAAPLQYAEPEAAPGQDVVEAALPVAAAEGDAGALQFAAEGGVGAAEQVADAEQQEHYWQAAVIGGAALASGDVMAAVAPTEALAQSHAAAPAPEPQPPVVAVAAAPPSDVEAAPAELHSSPQLDALQLLQAQHQHL